LSSLTSKLATVDRRVLALIAAAIVIVLIAATVGGVYEYQQTRPTTASLNLRDNQKEVALNQPLVMTFSRPISEAEAAANFRLSPAIDGALTASGGGRTYTWVSAGPWSDLTTYTVRLSGFTDATSHRVNTGTWHFTTTIVPRVVAVTSDTGTAIADGADLPVGTALKIAFNALMDQSATKLMVNGNAAGGTWEADGKTLDLSTTGASVGPFELALAPGGHDTAGRPALGGWKLTANLVFHVNIHTTPLKFPALVQIPNDPFARDQSGIQSAGLVFEYATEGGITRLTAVFTKVPDKVGPVRSGRLISLKLTRHYGGELFLSGTSDGTFGVYARDPVPAFFDTAGFYYRTADHQAPNNLYISGDSIIRAQQSYSKTGTIATGNPGLSGGAPAPSVDVPDHHSTYAFDGATRTYTKTEDGHQMGDASIGQPLRIAMLVVLHTQITTTSIIEDVNGVHGLDYAIDGNGVAEFYYQGQQYTGKWSSPDRSSPLVFTTDGGQPIAIPPGLVWVDTVA
jgi:hypothetical protein